MAIRVNNGSGVFSSATLWETVTNVPTVHATTNINLNTTNLYSEVFTAPSLTGSCTGCIIRIVNAIPSPRPVITCQLQEYSGATWVDVGSTSTFDTALLTRYGTNNLEMPIIFRFAIPYMFTTTTAGYYRFRFVASTSNTSNVGWADASGTKLAYMAIDDRVGVLGATDDTYIIGGTGTTVYTVTQTSDITIGSSNNTIITARNWLYALSTGFGGKYTTDATNLNLTLNGSIGNYGEFDVNYSGTTNIYTILFNNISDGDYGFFSHPTSILRLNGKPKTSWKTTYVSGVGTSASPLVVSDAVDWEVGDQLMIVGTNNVSVASTGKETEYPYIITKLSASTYILSSTKGGSETALTYSHPDADVVNIERNVIIKGSDPLKAFYYQFQAGFYYSKVFLGYNSQKWYRFENVGTAAANRSTIVRVCDNGAPDEWDYNIYYNSPHSCAYFYTGANRAKTYTGNVATLGNASGFLLSTKSNHTLNDFFAVNLANVGISCLSVVGTTINRLKSINTGQGSYGYACITMSLCINATFNDCEVYLGTNGLSLTTVQNVTFNNFKSNIKAYVTTTTACDIRPIGSSPSVVFQNSEFRHFGTTRLFYNAASGDIDNLLNTIYLDGTSIGFHEYDHIVNRHQTFTVNGTFFSTLYSGSTNTNQRTAGSNSLRLMPTNIDGFFYEYKVVAKIGNSVGSSGFIKKDADMSGSTVTVELFLPGSLVADATYTMPNDTNWNLYSLAASYIGLKNGLATVRITAYGDIGNIYLDDISNGTNILTSIDTWDKGMPVEVMYDQLGDANAVWAVLPSTFNAGTVGALVEDALGDVETGYTVKDVFKIVAAVLAGKTNINVIAPGQATTQYRDLNDSLNRVDSTMNGSERTNINLDLS